VEILHRRYFEGVPKMVEMLEAQRIKGEIAQQLYDLRDAADLTQSNVRAESPRPEQAIP
jgi:hypothetical protein